MPSKIITAMAFVVTLTAFVSVRADTQEQAAATFRSSVDLVRVSAVVRDLMRAPNDAATDARRRALDDLMRRQLARERRWTRPRRPSK